MRTELRLIEIIDRYLDGELSSIEVAEIENRIAENEDFAALLEDQRALRAGIKRMEVRQAAQKAYQSYQIWKWGPGLGGMIVLALILLFAIPYFTEEEGASADIDAKSSEAILEKEPTNGDVELSATDPLEARDDQQSSVKDTETKNEQLWEWPTTYYELDPTKNFTQVTPSGMVLDIPSNSFLHEDGTDVTKPIRLEFREALDAKAIMRAGLCTMSGEQLLETGGMFYLDAQSDGRSLKINPDKLITAMVPDYADLGDMQLFQGQERKDGSIDWQSPKPLVNSLVPVDINTLDFYPPDYLPRLLELEENVANKDFTDSLYFSFAWNELPQQPLSESTMEHVITATPAIQLKVESSISQEDTLDVLDDVAKKPENVTKKGINPGNIKTIWNARFNNTNLATRAFEERLPAIFATCENEVLEEYVNNLGQESSRD